MRDEFIQPFVSATSDVFQTMLGCELTGGTPAAGGANPVFDVSGLIGLSGVCRGMVVVSMARATALKAAGALLGLEPSDLDADVLDAIGELTNMIGGTAKTRLEEYALTIGLPTVICGTGQRIMFPSGAVPLVIPFDSEIGTVCIQVGLSEPPKKTAAMTPALVGAQ